MFKTFVSLLSGHSYNSIKKPILKIEQVATKFETRRVNSLVFPPFERIQDSTVQTILQGRAVFMAVH
jgi:hypothetical protein